MKTIFTILLLIAFSNYTIAQNKDLPGPVANLQTLPVGSYVIPMDNTLQTDNIIGTGNFNLASYGLIVHLLNNNVKIKWVIRAGKSKDGIDFTGQAEQLKPTFTAGAVARNFIAGPFVIFANDTTGVASLIDGFYTSNLLTLNSRPKVFRLSAAVSNVDIRYDLAGFIPKVAILIDGGKADIHQSYMTACKISTTNYKLSVGNDLLTRCFTFASEPHNERTGANVDATISAIKRFVEYGGNFLAQCAAISNYENNSLGGFQTVGGLTVQNASIGTALSYPNADLSFSQFQGVYNASATGTVMNWRITLPKNNEHNHATGTGLNALAIGASVSKLKTGNGGLVFYVGNHEFRPIDVAGINGIRMYMNAVLTPVSINRNCNTGELFANPLPIKLSAFSATLSKNQKIANLKWTTVQEINASYFVIERSSDGIHFNAAGSVNAGGTTNEPHDYFFTDYISTISSTKLYYRLRQVDADGRYEFSSVRILNLVKQHDAELSIQSFPNPVSNELQVTIPNKWQGKNVIYEIISVNGYAAKKVTIANSNQTQVINTSSVVPGFYIVKVSCGNETTMQKIIRK